MKLFNKIILAIFLLVLVVLAYAGLYVYSLSKVEIRDLKFNSMQNVSATGFTLNGYIEIYNGGILPVSMDHINYDIILESSGSVLTSGYIEGKKIPAGKSVMFPTSNYINWIPTAELAAGMFDKNDTYAIVKGTAYIADVKFTEFKIPFEVRINLEQYIRQFIASKIDTFVDKASDFITGMIGAGAINESTKEGIEDAVKQFLKDKISETNTETNST
jgi:hypothetical protein